MLTDGGGDSDNDNEGKHDVEASDIAAVPSSRTKQAVLVGLSAGGQLFVDGNLLASNCNSFVIHDSFLIFSTHDHVCKFFSTQESMPRALERFRANTAGAIITLSFLF